MTKKQTKTRGNSKPVADDITELLSQALALEHEASDRYAELAELMEVHNNIDVAKLFERMAEIEKLHVDQILRMVSKQDLADLPRKEWQWISPEGPETTNPEDLHYLMKPYHALQLALVNEQRAFEYYDQIAKNTSDEETRSLAEELATEEEEHVALVKVWMDKYPEMDKDWDYDDDPPLIQD
jgi:rubrerythrin